MNISFFLLEYQPPGMWDSENRGYFYHTGSPPLLSFGTSLTLAQDPSLIFFISQSIGPVFLWCFLLFSGFGLSGSCLLLSSGIPHVLEVLSSSGAMCLSLCHSLPLHEKSCTVSSWTCRAAQGKGQAWLDLPGEEWKGRSFPSPVEVGVGMLGLRLQPHPVPGTTPPTQAPESSGSDSSLLWHPKAAAQFTEMLKSFLPLLT